MACSTCDLVEAIRQRWAKDVELQSLVKVASNSSNRVYERGNATDPKRPFVVLTDAPEAGRSVTSETTEVQRLVRVQVYTDTKQQASQIAKAIQRVFGTCGPKMCVEDGIVLRGRVLFQGSEYVAKGVFLRQLLIQLRIAHEWS